MSDIRLVVVAGLLTIALAFGVTIVGPPPEAAGGDGSSYSAGSRGGKALFETLQSVGYPVERSLEPLASLPADAATSVLIVTGSLAPSDLDRRGLRSFVEKGGTVLLVGKQGTELLGVTGADLPVDPLATPSTHRALAASPLVRGVQEISMVAASGARLPPEYLPLFALSPNEPLVATAVIGGGRAIWLAAVTPLTNEHARAADNLQFVLNVLGAPGERRILWDEHYHGYSRSLWSYAAATPLPWVLLQAGLLGLAALATFSRRRLPMRSRSRDVRSSPLEFIEMLRILYARAGDASSAVASARQRFRRRVSQVSGLTSAAPDEAIARAAAARCGTSNDEVMQLLARTRDATTLDRAAALPAIQRLQELSGRLDRRPTPQGTS